MTRIVRAAGVLLPTVLSTGCSCRQDYTFPDAEDPVPSAEAGDVGSWLSLDVAPDGARLTMAYYDRVAGGLMYAIGQPTDAGGWDWSYEKVDGWPASNGLDSGDRGKYASQRTAPDGTVWIAYQDVANGALLVAHRTGGPVWALETVGAVGGEWASLALDADGSPVVAHQDPESGTLKVSRRNDDGTWATESAYVGQAWDGVDDAGAAVHRDAAAGRYARLEIVDGREIVAFYDGAQQQLVLLEGSGGSWQTTIVDGAGASTPGAVADAGAWPSLLVDGSLLRVAYQDVGNQRLRVATRTVDVWQTETVDPTAWRGADTELFYRDGAPAIVYFDGYENNQILAEQQADGTWTITKLGGDGAAIGYHNEVVEVSGRPWIGSYDFTNHALVLGALED